jgi:hypothetical protein
MSSVLYAQPYVGRARAVVVEDNVIAAKPTLSELSLVERGALLAPYIGYALIAVALLLTAGLARRLYARYRHENVAVVAPVRVDPRSLRKRGL